MYWDVVEVKTEPDYCLFVKFKDGLTGRVKLRREELTGALSPLLDVRFFEQVFIDNGVVTWPGEIDLAPDAMYAEVASQFHEPRQPANVDDRSTLRFRLPRFYELRDLLTDPAHSNAFKDCLEDQRWLGRFVPWERELQRLDPAAWTSLKRKASKYLAPRRGGPKDRGFQQLFDALGEARAYNYLKEVVGCSTVFFIPESDNQRRPDLKGESGEGRILCEVKTINVSDEEKRARREPNTVRSGSDKLDPGFLKKLDWDIASAKSQLQSYDPCREAEHLVFINVCFDDPYYDEDYLSEINWHLSTNLSGITAIVRVEVSGREIRVVAQH